MAEEQDLMGTETGVPAAPEPSIEERLSAVFSGKSAPAAVADEQQPLPVSAEEQPQAGTEQEGAEQSDDQQPEEQAEEVDELEHLGRKYAVPKSLKTAFEENRALTTRTTQELAVIRRAVEADRLALQATATFHQQITPALAKLEQLRSYKEQAKTVDWSGLTLDQKVDLDRELRKVDEQINDITGRISQGYAVHQQNIGQAVVAAVGETEAFMSQRVPGWNAERGSDLHQYGTQLGIPKEKLITGWFADPLATLSLWKAQQWDRLQASKPGVMNKASGAAPSFKPTSNAAQQSTQQVNYKLARQQLKKTGSLEDAARLFKMRMK